MNKASSPLKAWFLAVAIITTQGVSNVFYAPSSEQSQKNDSTHEWYSSAEES